MKNDTKGLMIKSHYFKGDKKNLKFLLNKAKSITIEEYIEKYHSRDRIDYTIFNVQHGWSVLNEITRRLQHNEEISRDDLFEMIDGLDKSAQFDFRAIRIYNLEWVYNQEEEDEEDEDLAEMNRIIKELRKEHEEEGFLNKEKKRAEIIDIFPFNDVHMFDEHKQMAINAIQEEIIEMNTEDPAQDYYFFRNEDEVYYFNESVFSEQFV